MSIETAFVIMAAIGVANLVATLLGVLAIARLMNDEHATMMQASHNGQIWLYKALKGKGE